MTDSTNAKLRELRERMAGLTRYSVFPHGNEIGMSMSKTGEWYFGPDVLRLIDAMIQEAGE